ncbi:MAG: peptidoglycan DD-metalloendopeptidase family protein [Leptolyngbya sp. SIO4C1]|nr:peptidoglycan DD-metalloendopeptidase family protein [Leptolyngbya sp. SIO4C1]
MQKISRSLGVPLADLVEANQLDDPNVILAGADLLIPAISAASATEPAAELTADLPEPAVAIAADRLSRLQATASRPVESVTLLSRLRGETPSASEAAEPSAAETASGPIAVSPTAPADTLSATADERGSADDVYLANLLEDVAAAEAASPASAPSIARVEPVETARPAATILAAAPLDNADWVQRQRPTVGDTVEPETPLLPSASEYLPQPSDEFDGYVWPTRGTLTSGYGWRWGRMHRGVDIAAPVGTPVMAAAPGVVEYAQWNSGGYGNLVDIRHSDGSLTRYAHNDRLIVRAGQRVRQGQLIAEMGSTGYSTGPHLHFEIHQPRGGTTNPMALLPERL